MYKIFIFVALFLSFTFSVNANENLKITLLNKHKKLIKTLGARTPRSITFFSEFEQSTLADLEKAYISKSEEPELLKLRREVVAVVGYLRYSKTNFIDEFIKEYGIFPRFLPWINSNLMIHWEKDTKWLIHTYEKMLNEYSSQLIAANIKKEQLSYSQKMLSQELIVGSLISLKEIQKQKRELSNEVKQEIKNIILRYSILSKSYVFYKLPQIDNLSSYGYSVKGEVTFSKDEIQKMNQSTYQTVIETMVNNGISPSNKLKQLADEK